MTRCSACGGPFDPLSRQATQNAMGPWFVRDQAKPFRPGCSFAELRRASERGRITPETVIRGPTTHQFWAPARRVPGLANLLGSCHACSGEASGKDYVCRHCGVAFPSPADRQHLGLIDTRPLPGRDRPEAIVSLASPGRRSDTGGRAPDERTPVVGGSIDSEDVVGAGFSFGRARRRSALWPVAAMVACALVVGVGIGVIAGRLPALVEDGLRPMASELPVAAGGDEQRGVAQTDRRDARPGAVAAESPDGVGESTESRVPDAEVVSADAEPEASPADSQGSARAWDERLLGLLLEDSLGSVATARELVRTESGDGRDDAILTRVEGYVDRRFQVVRIRTLP